MVFLGSVGRFALVWDSADLFMGFMAVINLLVILKLSPIALATLSDYRKQRKDGKNPVFYAKNISELGNVECWSEEN